MQLRSLLLSCEWLRGYQYLGRLTRFGLLFSRYSFDGIALLKPQQPFAIVGLIWRWANFVGNRIASTVFGPRRSLNSGESGLEVATTKGGKV